MTIIFTNRFTKCTAYFVVERPRETFRDPREYGRMVDLIAKEAAEMLGCDKQDLTVDHVPVYEDRVIKE